MACLLIEKEWEISPSLKRTVGKTLLTDGISGKLPLMLEMEETHLQMEWEMERRLCLMEKNGAAEGGNNGGMSFKLTNETI